MVSPPRVFGYSRALLRAGLQRKAKVGSALPAKVWAPLSQGAGNPDSRRIEALPSIGESGEAHHQGSGAATNPTGLLECETCGAFRLQTAPAAKCFRPGCGRLSSSSSVTTRAAPETATAVSRSASAEGGPDAPRAAPPARNQSKNEEEPRNVPQQPGLATTAGVSTISLDLGKELARILANRDSSETGCFQSRRSTAWLKEEGLDHAGKPSRARRNAIEEATGVSPDCALRLGLLPLASDLSKSFLMLSLRSERRRLEEGRTTGVPVVSMGGKEDDGPL